MNLQELIRLRKKKNVSQVDLAKTIGLKSPSSWSRVENGKKKLPADALPAIAEKLGLSLFELVFLLFFNKKLEQSSNEKAS